jgi:glycosyltransferase involved in cell wall biosynthesis
MGGEGARFLSRSLEAIRSQSFSDYETVVSDHSADNKIEEVCARFAKVRYVRNPSNRGKSSANLNNAIDHASGDLIKVVFQDDFLAGPGSLGRIADSLGDKHWLVHSYWHTDLSGAPRFWPNQPFIPDRPSQLLRCNSIGAPTAIAFKKCALRFDQNLRWKMDCEFYYQLLRKLGRPSVVSEPLAVQTLWPGQLTHKLSDGVKAWEYFYVQGKILRQRLHR